MTAYPAPPAWATLILRSFVPRRDADTVPGDLLEMYRDSIHPARGERRADRWFIQQVAYIVVRRTAPWAILFAAAIVVRNAFDWFLPVHDFSARSLLTTKIAGNLLLVAGAWAGWRSGSIVAGPIAGFATALIAAVISTAASTAMLAVWHDPATMAAIRGSGGIEEVFTLPYVAVALGVVLGTIGGVAGVAMRLCSSRLGTGPVS